MEKQREDREELKAKEDVSGQVYWCARDTAQAKAAAVDEVHTILRVGQVQTETGFNGNRIHTHTRLLLCLRWQVVKRESQAQNKGTTVVKNERGEQDHRCQNDSSVLFWALEDRSES